MESLKKELEELQSKKNNAKEDSKKRDLQDKISSKEKEMQTLENKILEWQRRIDEDKKQIASRLSVGKQCRDYRLDVQKAFAEAKRYLQNESSPDVKPHADKIVKKIESEEPGHRTAIETVEKGISKCERM